MCVATFRLAQSPPAGARLIQPVAHLRTRAVLAALRIAIGLAGIVPRHSAEPLCRLVGTAWYVAAPAARDAVRFNLRRVLGHEPEARLVRAVFQHGALSYWDTFALPHLRLEQARALMDVDGWQHLDAALAAGKGAILAGAHLASVSLTSSLIAANGYPATGVMEPLDSPELRDLLAALRRAFGTRIFPLGPRAARELLAALRRNEVLGLIADRDITGTGPVVDFFGAPTTFPDGPATLSLKTGAPILVGVAPRRADGRFQGVIEPALDVPRTGDSRRDVLALTQALAWRLEYHIRAHPDQWTVFQKRWPDNVALASHRAPPRAAARR